MKYFNRKYFTDDQGERLEHSANKKHAEYGTKNSTVDEKGTDGKKNNSSEYNHEYYTENKEKWQKKNKGTGKRSNNDSLYYDKDGKARFGHKLYDPNDPDFKRTDGELIPGTNLRVFTNQNGSLIVMGDGVKFSYPPGTQLTAEMKKEIADVEKNKGNLNDEQYVAKMHNAVTKFADNQGLDTDAAGTDKAKKKKSSSSSSSKKKSSSSSKKSSSKKSTKKEEKKEETASASTSTQKTVDGNAAFNRAKSDYYANRRSTPHGKTTNSAAAKKKAEELKKKKNTSLKQSDDLGSVFIKDIF